MHYRKISWRWTNQGRRNRWIVVIKWSLQITRERNRIELNNPRYFLSRLSSPTMDLMDFISSIRGFLAQARLVSNLFVIAMYDSSCTRRSRAQLNNRVRSNYIRGKFRFNATNAVDLVLDLSFLFCESFIRKGIGLILLPPFPEFERKSNPRRMKSRLIPVTLG